MRSLPIICQRTPFTEEGTCELTDRGRQFTAGCIRCSCHEVVIELHSSRTKSALAGLRGEHSASASRTSFAPTFTPLATSSGKSTFTCAKNFLAPSSGCAFLMLFTACRTVVTAHGAAAFLATALTSASTAGGIVASERLFLTFFFMESQCGRARRILICMGLSLSLILKK